MLILDQEAAFDLEESQELYLTSGQTARGEGRRERDFPVKGRQETQDEEKVSCGSSLFKGIIIRRLCQDPFDSPQTGLLEDHYHHHGKEKG